MCLMEYACTAAADVRLLNAAGAAEKHVGLRGGGGIHSTRGLMRVNNILFSQEPKTEFELSRSEGCVGDLNLNG